MKHLSERGRIPREGERRISDPTDPEWEDKRLNRMAEEYNSLDEHYRQVYLEGLGWRDLEALKARGLIPE